MYSFEVRFHVSFKYIVSASPLALWLWFCPGHLTYLAGSQAILLSAHFQDIHIMGLLVHQCVLQTFWTQRIEPIWNPSNLTELSDRARHSQAPSRQQYESNRSAPNGRLHRLACLDSSKLKWALYKYPDAVGLAKSWVRAGYMVRGF